MAKIILLGLLLLGTVSASEKHRVFVKEYGFGITPPSKFCNLLEFEGTARECFIELFDKDSGRYITISHRAGSYGASITILHKPKDLIEGIGLLGMNLVDKTKLITSFSFKIDEHFSYSTPSALFYERFHTDIQNCYLSIIRKKTKSKLWLKVGVNKEEWDFKLNNKETKKFLSYIDELNKYKTLPMPPVYSDNFSRATCLEASRTIGN